MGSFFVPDHCKPGDWGQLLTAMITPFNPDGSVNFKEARRVARYLVEVQQNDGLIVSGTTGESPTLSSSERLQLLEEVLDEVGDRAAIVFGAGSNDTADSVEMTQAAEARGAHGVMIVNPYYNKPGQRGLIAHFTACAQATTLPVLIYNIIPRSAINLDTPSLLEIAKLPNVVAVKEASGNLPQISDVCAGVPSGFRVYSGDDGLTLPILSLGGIGVVSVAGHVVGSQIKEMIRCFSGDPSRAAMIHHSIMPVVKACFCAANPSPVKYMLSRLGFDTETLRLPLVPVDEGEKAAIDAVFKI